jgi:alpha-pyrone synthase
MPDSLMNLNPMEKEYKATSQLSSERPSESTAKKTLFKAGAMNSKRILPSIESIATGTPDKIIRQSEAAEFVANLPGLNQNRHRIRKLYRNTRIEKRHLALNFLSDEGINHDSRIQARMEMYKEYAVPLAGMVAGKALKSASRQGENIEDSLRLIVFVSSTGLIAPGIDTELIKSLGLRRDTARVTLNFMGCAAAMNGLRVASDHVRANPSHKALVVCLELSSINAVFEDKINDVIIHSIFSDGCAAVVIGSCAEEEAIGQGKIILRDHLSHLVEDTEDGIVLGVHDRGITCQLSRQLPDYLENGVGPIIEGFLASHGLTKENIDLWAVHPGGTRIIESVQRSLGLSDSQVADSWEILSQYGNMLSPAVLFVMERMLFRGEKESLALHPPNTNGRDVNGAMKALTGVAFSFSPGVGVEGILFQKL